MYPTLTIEELVSEIRNSHGLEISPRTIRFYIAEGVLRRPDERGKFSVAHLNRLKLILILKLAFLPVSEIGERLNLLSDDDVLLELEKYFNPSSMPASNLAADYTRKLMEQRSYLPQPAPVNPISRFREPSLSEPAPIPMPPMPLVQTISIMPSAGAVPGTTSESISAPMSISPAPLSRARSPDREIWLKVKLSPTIELQALQPLSEEDEIFVKAIEEYARQLSESGKGPSS